MPKFQIEYTRKVYGVIEVDANSKGEAEDLFYDGDYDELTDHCTTEGAEIISISKLKKGGKQ